MSPKTKLVVGCVFVCFLIGPQLPGQERVIVTQGGRAVTLAPQASTPGRPSPNATAKPPQSKDNEEADKAEDKSDSADEKKADEGDGDDSIKRPKKPPRIPDPREFDAKPDENGLLRFNFYGQSWPDILQWLASISDYSLDWQEMPSDYVNITTTRRYTVDETVDLFNRLLMDRGYTMIKQRRILSVAKIAKLDPSLLKRVADESELLDLPAHEFVKITFDLPDELKADKASEEVKPLLSPHAKVQPLLATNRLLVIDAVVNLRDVSQLVNSEFAAATEHEVPREFVIRYARADRVADQVMILLGLDPASRRTPQELQLEAQRLQLFTQMQQRNKDPSKFMRQPNDAKVYLAVSNRNNTILANARPAEMKIIARAIEQLDIPSGFATPLQAQAMTITKYQLVTMSPESIVGALDEIGDLDPRTRLKTDEASKTVFANATPADHEKIQAMIDRLDGTGRSLEVIWLRNLPADGVAMTIEKLLGGKEEEEEDNSRSMFGYYRYSRYGNEDESPKSTFRVDADVERNRLLLWANDAEIKEVRKFLEKLGEIPGRTGNPHTVRILDTLDTNSTLEVLEQLREMWNGPNDLLIEPPKPEEPDASTQPDGERPFSPDDDSVAQRSNEDDLTSVRSDSKYRFVVEDGAASKDKTQTKTSRGRGDAAPIHISVTPDGRVMLRSDDTEALDRIEDLLNRIAPPTPRYEVFYLKYALASLVTLNLEEYFEEEGEFDTQENWMRAWYGMDFKKSDSGGAGLSKRRKIRFIYDFDTNSVLVMNASQAQMSVVRSLIDVYDVAPSEDSISARTVRTFKLKYSKAEAIAATIKEVYRDLLSSKDKAFANQGKDEKQQSSQIGGFYRISGGTGEDKDEKPKKVKASFAGALSVGVDDISNIVIVSAQEEWMAQISQIIEYLDESARPDSKVSVYAADGQINVNALRTALGIIKEEPTVERSDDESPATPGPNGQRGVPQPGKAVQESE